MKRALAVISLIALAVAGAPPAGAAEQTVRSAGIVFVPPVVVAGGSDRITLQNLDPLLQHTFTTEAQLCRGAHGTRIACNTGVAAFNVSKSVELWANPGTYDFFCAIHGSLGMVGRLVVQ